MSAQPIEAVERDDPLEPRNPYRRFLRGLTEAEVRLERGLNELVSYEQNPFYFHGALPTFAYWMLILSGLGLLFYYKPTLAEAYGSLNFLDQVPFGTAIRSSHRYSADVMLIFVYLHMLRVYVTDRHREYRWQPWVTGVLLLGLTYFVGINGYFLCGETRAWGLLYHTREALQSVPLFGSQLDVFFLGGSEVTDFTVVRQVFFHVGGAITIFWLLWMHLLRIRRPMLVVTIGIGAVIIGLVLVWSALFPAHSYYLDPSNLALAPDPKVPPTAYAVGDWLFLPGYWVLATMGPLMFWLATAGLLVLLCFVPWALHDSRRNIAHVVRDKCVGCQLCAIDCPYQAIRMVPVWNERKNKPDLLAVVYPPRCSECGVCVGSCDFDAIELGSMPYQTIDDLVKNLAPKRDAAPTAGE